MRTRKIPNTDIFQAVSGFMVFLESIERKQLHEMGWNTHLYGCSYSEFSFQNDFQTSWDIPGS